MNCEGCARADDFPYCTDCIPVEGYSVKQEITNDNKEK